MTTENDLILGAIADGLTKLSAIAEATGLEAKTVSNRLFLLKQKGKVWKTGAGWELMDGVVVPPPPGAPRLVPLMSKGDIADGVPTFVTPKPKPDVVDPTPRRKANGKHRPAPVTVDEPAPTLSPAAPIPVERELEFAISESGAVLFKCVAGDRAGQLGEINCADALALYRLMSNVEFITENA